jgi:CspA family cold shock protein
MAHGTVKFFNAAKGFGFITSDDDGKDIFVPAASVTAAGIPGLKTGQRLTFDSEPDKKGLKAVGLKLLDEPVRAIVEKKPPAPQPEKSRLTLYLDPSDEDGEDALDALRDAGHDPRVVDYITNPPDANELKSLSLLLRDGNQSLVRKYEPMFLELRLDDRFISDTEFWGAIHEHPSLINGPVVASATMASVCRTEQSLQSFLDALSSGGAQPVAKPKGLSDRLMRLVAGEALPPRPMKALVEKPAAAPEKAVAAPAKENIAPVKLAPKAKAAEKPIAKPKAAAAKAKAPEKKAAAKPVKKTKK